MQVWKPNLHEVRTKVCTRCLRSSSSFVARDELLFKRSRHEEPVCRVRMHLERILTVPQPAGNDNSDGRSEGSGEKGAPAGDRD